MTTAESDCRGPALTYAVYGWRLVPIHSHTNGCCSCGNPNCASPGKHPRLTAWQDRATDDEDRIGAWWEQWPGANVGVRLGPTSCIIDLESDGDDAEGDYAQLFEGAEPPVCPTFGSSRGKHRLFAWDPRLTNCRKAVVHFGALEVRLGIGDKAAQSLLPPSITNGHQRRWLPGLTPEDVDAPPLPEVVIKRILESATPGGNGQHSGTSAEWSAIRDGVPKGKRNDAAATVAGKVLRSLIKLDDESIDAAWLALVGWNAANHPPMAQGELRSTFESIVSREQARRETEGQSGDGKPFELEGITCRELDGGDYAVNYLIDRTLVEGQPALICAPHKAMKTSLVVDMAVSLAVGGFFLGKLKCQPARVGVMSGESGMSTIQETARRVADAAGHRLGNIDGLIWSSRLPRLNNAAHLAAFKRWLEDYELSVAVLDPTYMAMPGGDAGNLFIQGELLRPITEICQEAGCTLAIVHHSKRGVAAPHEPPALADVSWAGFSEWCRQWLLLSRRERYEPGTGIHRLWLSCGGSAGHSALWCLDIDEGAYDPEMPRTWDVSVTTASEGAQRSREDRRKQREREEHEASERHQRKILEVLYGCPGRTETKTAMRDLSGLNSRQFAPAFVALLREGTIEECRFQKYKRREIGYRPVKDPQDDEF